MRSEDIDLILARNDNIVPSSGFADSVMGAIIREATEPPPIPFPWKRALPGLGWCLAVSIAFLTMGPRSGDNPPPVSGALDLPAVLSGAVWISAALMVSLLSVALSLAITRTTQPDR
jgi:hypothetical protein